VLAAGSLVRHGEFGGGVARRLLGSQVEVAFVGGVLVLPVAELTLEENAPPVRVEAHAAGDRKLFRKAFEAVNLGVVPPHPDQLLALSVGGNELKTRTRDWLDAAPGTGLCKVVFGDYGRGKSHQLRVVEALALASGWAVSFVEFDPRQADPAKPHLVYQAIMAALRLPRRQDGTQARGVHDFVGEVRRHWDRVVDAPHFRESPWFDAAFEVFRKHPHNDERDYVDAIAWLFGQIQQVTAFSTLARSVGLKPPRSMPRTLETSEIYVHHLVVVNELCRRLGYKGLLILLDEAEHVRGFNVNRRSRANNFFDTLAQAAHAPKRGLPPPLRNEHGIQLPEFWRSGPHFGVVVALTEGDTFAEDVDSIRDACVFLHDESDMIRLVPPTADEYRGWCEAFLREFQTHYPGDAIPLGGSDGLSRVASALAAEYANIDGASQALRLWTKLAGFVPALMFAGAVSSVNEIVTQLQRAARAASGLSMPWEA
jgi:hypothetical protein